MLPTLEPGSVDAVVTDPPYGIGFKYESHDDDAETYESFMLEVVAELERLRGDGPVVVWQAMLNCNRWHRWFPSGFRLFAACKGFVQFRPVGVQYSWDPIVFWGTPRGEPSVYKKDWHAQMLAPFGAGREHIDHPCPRPFEQVVYVTDTFTELEDAILDPFMGSGTTGVACVRLGRKFLGIEKEPKYFDIAKRRIITELERMPLLEKKPTYRQNELIPA